MPDPVNKDTAAPSPQTKPPPAPPPAPASSSPPPPPTPSFEDLLVHLSEHLREHPEAREKIRHSDIVAGIAGEIGERIATDKLAAAQRDAADRAALANEQAMLRLARDDPEAFAKKFETDAQAEFARRQLETLRSDERNRIASHVGRALTDLPGWKLLTQEDLASLAQKMVGVPDEQVIGVYNKEALSLISQRRAEEMAESRLADRLKAEREAWNNETAAKRVRTAPAPRIERAAPAPESDQPDFRADPDGYNRWYEENVLRRRR